MTNVWLVSDVMADEPAFERDLYAYKPEKMQWHDTLLFMVLFAVWPASIFLMYWKIIPTPPQWVVRTSVAASAGVQLFSFVKHWLPSLKIQGRELNFTDSIDLTRKRVGGMFVIPFLALAVFVSCLLIFVE